jgi:hypothetical protein
MPPSRLIFACAALVRTSDAYRATAFVWRHHLRWRALAPRCAPRQLDPSSSAEKRDETPSAHSRLGAPGLSPCEARVPLEEAAAISGYNADSLRHLVHDRKLAAERRGRRLYFRVADLPRKGAERVDASRLVTYDPIADARKVAEERAHGV